MEKKRIFSVTKKDLIFEYFSGTGKGGQHRNKHQNCCRCKHPPSGAIGACQEHRSKEQNTKIAFKRMAESKEFTDWVKFEAAKQMGIIDEIERKVERSIKDVKVEIKNEDGRWVNESKEQNTK